MDQSQQTLHTEGYVADYFLLESRILSTRTADAYKAIDKSRNVPITLWTLRHQLALNSEAVRRYLSRMYVIARADARLTDMNSYGVDAAGTAFAVFPPLDGHQLIEGAVDHAEAERRFVSCLRFAAKLHASSVVCGDLCPSSFWVNRSGDVRFIGVMGSFDAEAVATAMLPPTDSMPFLAPEQRSGGGIEPATDVFALGVIGYNLFTGTFPYGEGAKALTTAFDVATVKPVSEFLQHAPLWSDEILLKCLSPSPGDRFLNAEKLLQAITDFRQQAHTKASAPARIAGGSGGKDMVPVAGQGPKDGVSQFAKIQGAVAPQAPAEEPREEKKSKLIPAAVAVLAGVGIAAALMVGGDKLFTKSSSNQADLKTDIEVHRPVVSNSQLKDAIDVLSAGDVDEKEREGQLEKLVNSDDPVAHDILVKSARDAKTAKLRELSEKAIIDRARRLSLNRSAEQVKQWLRSIAGNELPPSYEPILQSLDPTLPVDARGARLREAYATNQPLVLRLAVALALDSGDIDGYQSVLAQLVGDAAKLEDAKTHSSLALIIAEPNLATIFGDDVVQRRDQIPDADIMWLLGILAERNDINLRSLASSAIEKKVTTPLRISFLTVLRDRADLPADIGRALVRASLGALEIEDVKNMGRWYDRDASKILLAMCADTADKQLLTQAFEIIAGKNVSGKPASQFVQWIRQTYWNDRGTLMKPIAVLSNTSLVSEEEVNAALAALDPYFKDQDLVEIVSGIESPVVVRSVISSHGKVLGFGGLLNLLDSPNKEIRIDAIKGLKDFNDVTALKLIIEHFEKEKDPDVRQTYKDTFWMIKQRENS